MRYFSSLSLSSICNSLFSFSSSFNVHFYLSPLSCFPSPFDMLVAHYRTWHDGMDANAVAFQFSCGHDRVVAFSQTPMYQQEGIKWWKLAECSPFGKGDLNSALIMNDVLLFACFLVFIFSFNVRHSKLLLWCVAAEDGSISTKWQQNCGYWEAYCWSWHQTNRFEEADAEGHVLDGALLPVFALQGVLKRNSRSVVLWLVVSYFVARKLDYPFSALIPFSCKQTLTEEQYFNLLCPKSSATEEDTTVVDLRVLMHFLEYLGNFGVYDELQRDISHLQQCTSFVDLLSFTLERMYDRWVNRSTLMYFSLFSLLMNHWK